MSERPRDRTITGTSRLTIGQAVQVGVLLVVMVVGLVISQDWTRWLFYGVFFPIGIVGVVAHSGAGSYQSRLPRGSQIMLALILIAVSVPVGLLGERPAAAGLLWVFVVPVLFPGALPRRLQSHLQRKAARSQAASGPPAKGLSRKLVVTSSIMAVVVVLGVVLMFVFVPGTREVPRAIDGDAPDIAVDELPDETLVDLDAALDATFAQGSAHLRYRQHIDGEVRQFGVGRIDFDDQVATIGLTGTRQVFTGEQVLLRFGDDGSWSRVAVDEVSSAGGEPVLGGSSPWEQFELVARASSPEPLGVTEVSGIELARVGAVADVSATRDNIARDLRELVEQHRDDPDAFDDGVVDLDTVETMLARTEEHDGRLPIEVWIDGEQRIWRISYDLADWTTPPANSDAVQPATFAFDVRGFGLAGQIRLPDPTDIVDVVDIDDTDLPIPTPSATIATDEENP